jgi:hypothetical protein
MSINTSSGARNPAPNINAIHQASRASRNRNYRRPHQSHSLDFARIAQAAVRHAERLVPAWLPGGRRRGREWVVRNPRRADAHAGSFSINLRTGRWADFATGDRGGDLISLLAYLDGTSQLAAARKLQQELAL